MIRSIAPTSLEASPRANQHASRGFPHRFKSTTPESFNPVVRQKDREGQTRIARLLAIKSKLSTCVPVTLRALVTAHVVSERTIYRDLGTLIASGVPIEFDEGRRGYFVRSSSGASRGIAGTEAFALIVALGLAKSFLTPNLANGASKAIGVLVDSLPLFEQLALQSVSEAFCIRSTAETDAPNVAVFESLLSAVAHGMEVRAQLIDAAYQRITTKLSPPYSFEVDDRRITVRARSSWHRANIRIALDQLCSIKCVPLTSDKAGVSKESVRQSMT